MALSSWILLFSLVLLVFTFPFFVAAEEQSGTFLGGIFGAFTQPNPMVYEWYAVSEQEINFCSNWGGYQSLMSGQGIVEDSLPPVGKLTLTVQGLYTELVEVDDKRLYEVAWYVHPLTGDVAYVVYLVDTQGRKEEAEYGRGNANALDGDSNYVAFESEKEYTHVLLEIEDGGTLQVPFVEKEQ